MFEKPLDGLRIAVLAADGFEQVEVTRPVRALEKHGAEVEIVSLRPGSIQGMNLLYPGKKIGVDRTVFTADPDAYVGLHLPGGFINPDFLRQSEDALDFVRAFDRAQADLDDLPRAVGPRVRGARPRAAPDVVARDQGRRAQRRRELGGRGGRA